MPCFGGKKRHGKFKKVNLQSCSFLTGHSSIQISKYLHKVFACLYILPFMEETLG